MVIGSTCMLCAATTSLSRPDTYLSENYMTGAKIRPASSSGAHRWPTTCRNEAGADPGLWVPRAAGFHSPFLCPVLSLMANFHRGYYKSHLTDKDY